MRVVRVLAGMLVLLIAVPVLGAGALAWWVMQHRSPDGTFRAKLGEIAAPSRIVVVPDVDALLHRDAPIARADQTELRLTVANGGFVGMAAPADLAAYLAGVNYTELAQTRLGQGPLAVRTRQIVSSGEVVAPPADQTFWIRRASEELRWSPAADRDRHISLIVIAPPGEDPIRLSVALTAGWLNSTTWGLLILGPVLLLLGLAALAWPQRPREIVYVVDGGVAAAAGFPAPAFPALADSAPIWRPAVPASAAPFSAATGAAPASAAAGGPMVVPQPAAAPAVEADADAGLDWPPSEPDDATPSARLADFPSGEELPPLPPVPAGTPMPTAGMQLHLTKRT